MTIDFPQAADDEAATPASAAAAAAAAALGATSSNRISLIKSIAQFCEKHAAATAAPLEAVLAAAADAVRGKVTTLHSTHATCRLPRAAPKYRQKNTAMTIWEDAAWPVRCEKLVLFCVANMVCKHGALRCNMVRCVAPWCAALQHSAQHCSVMRCPQHCALLQELARADEADVAATVDVAEFTATLNASIAS